MQTFTQIFYNVTQALQQFGMRDVIDIAIITILIYRFLISTRQTRIIQVFKGVGILLVASIFAEFFKLPSVSWLLNTILQSSMVFVIVIFQPEIRKALEGIGRGGLLSKSKNTGEGSDEWIVQEISSALLRLSRRKVGALVVIQQRSNFSDIVSTGTKLDSRISSALLENIFEPNTPLHDGAVVISGERMVAAGCFLPLSENFTISKELGTRHRAALGISEMTDGITFVVSEETGIISYTKDGKIIRYLDKKAICDVLHQVYQKDGSQSSLIQSLFGKRKEDDHDDGQTQ